MCNGLGILSTELYYCMGQNDTLKTFNTATQNTYTPLIDGKPLITFFHWNVRVKEETFTYKNYIGTKRTLLGHENTFYSLTLFEPGLLAITRQQKKEPEFPSIGFTIYDKEAAAIYFFDLKNQTNILNLTDTSYSYCIINSMAVKAGYNKSTAKYSREFYDIHNGEQKFIITTDEKYLIITKVKEEHRHAQNTWYKFTCHNEEGDHGKVRGYYNLTTKKFSKRRK